jgi:hypothetical protein
MAWSVTTRIELLADDVLERRIRDLQLALVIGRARPQYAGPRTEDVKWRICEATFYERLPWEIDL